MPVLFALPGEWRALARQAWPAPALPNSNLLNEMLCLGGLNYSCPVALERHLSVDQTVGSDVWFIFFLQKFSNSVLVPPPQIEGVVQARYKIC